MMDTAKRWWRRWYPLTMWLVVDQVLPGATLFALLLWLSHRYLREGFVDVRQHALAPDAGKASAAAPVRRNWWSCTCANVGACRCLAVIAQGLRLCCAKAPAPAANLIP